MKILYLLFALFFLVVQSSAQVADRDVIGTAKCLLRRGGCFVVRCPRGTRKIGECFTFTPCCRS
uniref:As-beta-defensin-2 n=1 Tax=Apalone spinifera TaxID=55534 RepID=A0A0A1HAZ4_APASP|nr:As-beta-defensin-2 [Apalone spinifera]